MPRPRLCRRVGFHPGVSHFKPAGVPLRNLQETTLNIEELEAIRLKDFEELEQKEAAKKMDVSQPTFNRILRTARKKIAKALIKGQAIRIEGGDYRFR